MIRVTLGVFTSSAFEDYFGEDLSAGVRAAVVHYARRLRSGRVLLAPPAFLSRLPQPDGSCVIEATVDPEDEATYEEQARNRGMTVSQLVQHAVLVYLAELEFLGVPPRGGGA